MEESVPLVRRGGSEHDDFEMDDREYLLGGSSYDYYDMSTRGTSLRRGASWWYSVTSSCGRCFLACMRKCLRRPELRARSIYLSKPMAGSFPPNVVRNQKYNFFTFLPFVLYEQFKFFLNLYFLCMAVSQFIPAIKIGYLYTYWGPLGFVLLVTIFREAVDDLRRYRRDRDVNSQPVRKLTKDGVWITVPASHLKVGDIISVDKNQRVPADMVLLRSSDANGTLFIRTEQLDGETDWKLRMAVPETQALNSDADLANLEATLFVEKPQRDIHTFIGTFTGINESGLDIQNTLWGNTVVASGTATGVVVYTGSETRSVINNSQPRSKVGLFDLEVNNITKVLFVAVIGLALVMMVLKGFNGPWYRYLFRFILLFSYIIPLSLRVNLDISKAYYSCCIQSDPELPGTTVRSTTIPEELGRISYLLTDKTGTLTQNEMVMKKLHLENISYGTDSFIDVSVLLRLSFISAGTNVGPSTTRKSDLSQVRAAVEALALCHNVSPCIDADIDDLVDENSKQTKISYQASSPDEIALVEWTEEMGLTLVHRDLTTMQLKTPTGDLETFTILQVFPFTSETKRMGIIVRKEPTGEITFLMKGADVVMTHIVQYKDWLTEECDNLAREGLRTLVVARKPLTSEQYADFEVRYNAARIHTADRAAMVQAAIEVLEREMELVCVTGVEDRLQEKVRPTLELLRNAGLKIWMLTGDKLETAQCIAKSSRLVSHTQSMHVFEHVSTRTEAHNELNTFRRKQDACLVISGKSLDVCLQYYEEELMELACRSPAVICCRCSPTQKAQMVRLIQRHTGKRTAAVGDGGNDVSMIQMADAGVGVTGKEGLQASLAADFAISQFSQLVRLLLVHGRNSYLRSSALSQFIIHRGLIISVMQAVFSAVFYFSSVALYQGFLVVGYATVYTMFPVFSLVLDQDVTAQVALMYPELYKELAKGRAFSFKTFFIWVLISIYQGGVIMFGALFLFEDDFIHIVGISFTALIITELLMVALTIHTWHRYMALAEILSLGIYILSLLVFKDYFDAEFITTLSFFWKVTAITAISCVPLYFLKLLRKKFSPPSYSKLS